jgi:hypothetical protein
MATEQVRMSCKNRKGWLRNGLEMNTSTQKPKFCSSYVLDDDLPGGGGGAGKSLSST